MLVILLAASTAAAVDPTAPLTEPPGPADTPAGWNHRYGVPLDDVTLDQLAKVLPLVDASVVRIDPHLGFAVVTTRSPATLATHLGVSLVPDVVGYGATGPTDDPRSAGQWALTALAMPSVFQVQQGSRDVLVAIVDSGIDVSHPDLVDVPIVSGIDYVQTDLDPSDVHGHGTHIAGIITGTRDNGVGIAGMGAFTLLNIRVLDSGNSGSCLDFASGIMEAVVRGADVINLSLFCSSANALLNASIRAAEAADVVVVAAAGNFQADQPYRCVTTPASMASVIAVAALDPDLRAAAYSCAGPEVEVAAPGSGILSTLPNDRYAAWSGTSMATPHVVALAALLLSEDPSLSADEVRVLIKATARDLGAPGRDVVYGHGLIDPGAALSRV